MAIKKKLKKKRGGGSTWAVEHPTLDLGSGLGLRVMG